MSKKKNTLSKVNKTVLSRSQPVPLKLKDIKDTGLIFALVCIFLLVLLFAIRKISNTDTGFHLAAGRWIVDNFRVPVKDIFTYTVSNNEYLDIQWLYQVLIYCFYLISGYIGLTIFNTAILLTVFYMIFSRMRMLGVPVVISLLLLILTLTAIQIRFTYRPEIITWLFILCTLYILDKYFYFQKNRLYILPLIMLFWVNIHGLFIIGFIIITVYFISSSIQKKSADKTLLKWLLITIGAAFINPYFSEGVMFPFYLFTRLQKGNIFQQYITELQSPWGMESNLGLELYTYYAFSFISLVLVIATFRKRYFHQYILLAVFFFLSYSSFRNIPLFMIYSTVLIGVCLNDFLQSSKAGNKFILKYSRTVKIILPVIIFLISLRIITNAYYRNYNSEIKFGTGIDKTILPVQTAEFVDSNHVQGRMINNLESGGWLDWGANLKVFIDGRLEVIKEDLYKEYLSSFSGNGLQNLTGKYNADLIINTIDNYYWTLQIKEMKNWKLIHWDGTGAVYIKSDSAQENNFNFSSGLIYEEIDSNKFNPEETDRILNTGYIENFKDWFNGFYTDKTKYIELMRMGNFAMDNSQYRTAELCYLSFIEKSKGCIDEINYIEAYSNLGGSYYIMNDFKRSLFCYEKYLQQRPNDVQIKKRIIELKGKTK